MIFVLLLINKLRTRTDWTDGIDGIDGIYGIDGTDKTDETGGTDGTDGIDRTDGTITTDPMQSCSWELAEEPLPIPNNL